MQFDIYVSPHDGWNLGGGVFNPFDGCVEEGGCFIRIFRCRAISANDVDCPFRSTYGGSERYLDGTTVLRSLDLGFVNEVVGAIGD
jgi:hypothetical protein